MNDIQARRNHLGITQEELAAIIRVDRSTIAKWETGKAFPRAELLPKLAQIFGCRIDDLFCSENQGSKDK